ncbi:uncharacterized protein LOC110857394 isoform X3 [Folsomia candida]|uniref:uncharacterized protein LOC110857394 isoform X3 n=1 Tax=Folsomia candida TaxID=158441 RepID=UPI0016055B19|nr:uncharacterized protein LOC110857394 isoform X3 [Folsomia candida]
MAYENMPHDPLPPNIPDAEGRNVLHLFVENALDSDDARVQISTLICHYGIDLLFSTMNTSYTALHLAAMHFKPKILAALLNECGNPSEFCFTVDENGNTALHLACIWESKIRERKAALDCIGILLQASGEPGLLIDMKNRMGWTALHYGVKSNNLSTVKKLLQYYAVAPMAVNEELPILHFICGLNCESKTRIKILRRILKHEAHRINQIKVQPNGEKITALKIAVQNRQPKAVKELVKVGDLDLKWKDGFGRTALFYAVINGLSDKGNQCVFALFPRSRKFKGYDPKDVLEDCDTDLKTVFDYAQTNCSDWAMKTLMDTVLRSSAIFKYDALNKPSHHAWFAAYPAVLHYQMDNSFSYNKKDRGKLECTVSYITGIYENGSKTPETENVRKSVPSWSKEQQKALLLHPAMLFFVHEKSRKLQAIMRTLLLIQFIWITMIFWYFWLLINNHRHWLCFTSILIYTFYSTVYEVYECFGKGIERYVQNFTNVVQLLRNFSLILSVVLVDKSLAAVGILLSLILTMRHLRNFHRIIGQSIDILRQVVEQVIHVLFSCVVILAGFMAAIILIFEFDGTMKGNIALMNSSLPLPFMTLLVMMTGEIGFDEVGKSLEFGSEPLGSWASRLIVLTMFLVGIVIAFYNQLTGVALDKVQGT